MKLASAGFFERKQPASDAIVYAIKFLDEQFGIHPEFKELGESIKTTICELKDKGETVGSGIGKGLDDQCKASALYEAIEHFIWARSEPSTEPIPLRLDSLDVNLDNGSPDFRLICGSHEVSFSRVQFKRLADDSGSLMYPFFLTHPFWQSTHQKEKWSIDTFSLMRYSTNSGTASGLSRDEAILHAILEAIERDALGVELLRTIIRKKPLPVRRLLTSSFPVELNELLSSLKFENAELYGIWDFSAYDLQIPVILVGIIDRTTNRRYFGSGSSLSAAYAIERAFLESIQCMHMWRTKGFLPPPNEVTAGTPLYLRCMLDRGYFGYRGGEITLEFDNINTSHTFKELEIAGQIELIDEILTQCGFEAYFRSLADDIVHVTQVVIPRFELFHLVTSRIPVLPGARGKQILSMNF